MCEGLAPNTIGMTADKVFSHLMSTGWALKGDATAWYNERIGYETNSVGEVQPVFTKKLLPTSEQSQMPSDTDSSNMDDGGDSQ